MKMITRASKFTPQDATTLEALAQRAGVTTSAFINAAVGRAALEAGQTWEGKVNPHGDPARFKRER